MASILILGESGTGKTRSLTTLPGNLFVAEFDPSGERSIRRRLHYYEPGDANKIADNEPGTDAKGNKLEDGLSSTEAAIIRYLSISKTITKNFRLDDRWLGQKRIMDLFILDVNLLLTGDNNIQNVVVDPLTGLSRIAKGACFATAGTKGPTFKDWDLFAEKVLEIAEVSQGYEAKNFVLTAHIQTEKDAITEAIKESPYADGKKIPRTLMQAFDVIYQAMYRDGKYVWRTKPTETLQSIRNRLVDGDELPEYIDQDFSKLLSALPK